MTNTSLKTWTWISEILKLKIKFFFGSVGVQACSLYNPLLFSLLLLVVALVMTWVRTPIGQKNKHRETECLVSIWFSSPSRKTCLDLETHMSTKWMRKKFSNIKIMELFEKKKRVSDRFLLTKFGFVFFSVLFVFLLLRRTNVFCKKKISLERLDKCCN